MNLSKYSYLLFLVIFPYSSCKCHKAGIGEQTVSQKVVYKCLLMVKKKNPKPSLKPSVDLYFIVTTVPSISWSAPWSFDQEDWQSSLACFIVNLKMSFAITQKIMSFLYEHFHLRSIAYILDSGHHQTILFSTSVKFFLTNSF